MKYLLSTGAISVFEIMHSACGFDKSVTTVKCVIIDSGDINNFRVILILHGRRGPRNIL